MISVVIPALNEESTIGHVVNQAWQTEGVTEVIVVDDRSLDRTAAVATRHGATVITSARKGKGISMQEGVAKSSNSIIAFLDADILTYPDNVVHLLTQPLLNGHADFVKSYFDRQAGRVTELVAKPLLSILYPDFPTFRQPLSGMIAGRKTLLDRVEFEEGYGVDIGLLMDMHRLQATITEVNLGRIENDMQPLEELGKMSREVARTIIRKSNTQLPGNLETYENIRVIGGQMDVVINESLLSLKKLAIFDMDNTLLRGSFIWHAAETFGFSQALTDIVKEDMNPTSRTKRIATLLKGRTIAEILAVAERIDVTPNLAGILKVLKNEGYIVGIISDSYDCITGYLRNKYGFDFTVSNRLEFTGNLATGEVTIPSLFFAADNRSCRHDYCKQHAMAKLCEQYGVHGKNTLMIGDGENDICCLRKAGIGVSFCATAPAVDMAADFVIKEADFRLLEPILA